MTGDDKGSHKTQIIVAIIGLIGVLGAAFLSNWDKIFSTKVAIDHDRIPKVDTSSTEFERDFQPIQLTHPPVAQGFTGTYVGVSTEGFTQIQFKIKLTRNGNHVTGTYYAAGQIGKLEGTVNRNTLHYHWQSGNLFGKGISVENNGYVETKWGYGNSASNGGTSTAQRQ